MPRQARLDAPGVLHHVMVRGIEGSPIFLEDQDRQDFVSRIGELVQRTGTKVLAWVLKDLFTLSHEFGIPMAEIARHVGVCGSAVVKAIQKMDCRR